MGNHTERQERFPRPEHDIYRPQFVSASINIKKQSRYEIEANQDVVLVDNRLGMFGVFDGAGGGGGSPELAAQAARDGIRDYLKEVIPAVGSVDDMLIIMRQAFKAGRHAVESNEFGGTTTAVAAWYCKVNGEGYYAVGNAGDSQLFVYDTDTKAYQALTTQQNVPGYPNTLMNYFSDSPYGESRSNIGDEFFAVPILPTTRLIICSDGITGNENEELLTPLQYSTAFDRETPDGVARTLFTISRKDDDKSVVVVDVA